MDTFKGAAAQAVALFVRHFVDFKPHRIRKPRTSLLDGKMYLRYSGAHLRAIRRRVGVGRPPVARGLA
jgi:hypothetical protein